MIAAGVRGLARSLVELGLLFCVAGGLLIFLAYRLIRRFLVTGEDRLEEVGRPAILLLSLVAGLAASSARQTDT